MNIRGVHRRVTVALAATAIAVGGLGVGLGPASADTVGVPAPAGAQRGFVLPVFGDGDAGSVRPTPPQVTIPYEPPALDDGGVRSPMIPPSAWSGVERGIGRLAGKDLGMDALDDRECAAITAIHVPGTGETNDQRDPDVPHGRVVSGLGHDLAAEFGDDVRNLYLPYTSDAFLTASYAESAPRGEEALTRLVDSVAAACPTTGFVFTGYSQGADIVGGWAADALAGRTDAAGVPLVDRVVGVALFGNPRRGADVAVAHGTAAAGSTGILGPREGTWGVLGDRIFDSCNDGDLWCDSTRGMREIAPAVMSASFAPKDAAAARAVIEDAVGSGALADPEIREALGALLEFLIDGSSDHLQYEAELDGAPSARAEAAAFLGAKIAAAAGSS